MSSETYCCGASHHCIACIDRIFKFVYWPSIWKMSTGKKLGTQNLYSFVFSFTFSTLTQTIGSKVVCYYTYLNTFGMRKLELIEILHKCIKTLMTIYVIYFLAAVNVFYIHKNKFWNKWVKKYCFSNTNHPSPMPL